MFNFTPQEKNILLFLAIMFCVGGIIHIVRQQIPGNSLTGSERDSLIALFHQGVEKADSLTKISSGENTGNSVKVELPVNINTASLEELQKLPGIGPKTAQLIVEYRELHGGYDAVEDLLNIKGIGRKTLERIREEITVE